MFEYEPSSEVTNIVDRSGMTSKAKFYFFASKPLVEIAEDFNSDCRRQESSNAILGCYSNKNIYIYNVNNEELDGIEEVTAAHETLHAIWDRMSDTDRESVGVLLDKAYAKISDENLASRMDYYERNEPGERLNELHSILGSEYSNLGEDLENYYSKYFTDRTIIVAFYTNYQSVFDNLKKQSDSLFSEIQALKTSLDAKISQYNADITSLQNDYNSLVSSSGSVDLTSSSQVNQYNSKLNSIQARANQLDRTKSQILSDQETYNSKVSQYNKLVVASNDLIQSIDSTLEPSPNI